MLPAPPAEMTPALAALVGAPLNTTRAVTTALLDLAAHGRIAFYQQAAPLGPTGGINILSASGAVSATGEQAATGWYSAAAHSAVIDRPLGPAEQRLLEGLRVAAGQGHGLSRTDFVGLRPLFEQTGEELEKIAGQRGWLRLEARSVSWVWVAMARACLWPRRLREGSSSPWPRAVWAWRVSGSFLEHFGCRCLRGRVMARLQRP